MNNNDLNTLLNYLICLKACRKNSKSCVNLLDIPPFSARLPAVLEAFYI